MKKILITVMVLLCFALRGYGHESRETNYWQVV